MKTAEEIFNYLYLYRGDKQYDVLVDYARRQHAYFEIAKPFDDILAEALAA